MNRKCSIPTILILLLVFFLTCCVSKQKPEINTQQLVEYNKVITEAYDLYNRGCYICLKQAYDLYEQALSFPVFQKKTTKKLLKTAILLGLRERELGILQETYFPQAKDIIAASPYLADYSVLLKIASTIPRKTVGVVGDFIEDGSRVIVSMDDVKADLEEWTELFKEKSKVEEIYAYVAIGFFPTFSYFIKEKLDIESIEQAFPDSPLIRYKLSILPKGNPLNLEKLAQDDYQFYEAFFFLGQKALKKRLLVTAEKNFLKAYEHIPESSSLVISLASIYFAFEELDKSLEFYEKMLAVAPAHRDALLGKAMCLSYLGRHKEAINICNNMLSLGKYYLGESHYWLAWNQNELGEWENAWENIESSKKYLIGHAEVYSLAGVVAFNQSRLDESEKNFLKAYKLDTLSGDPPYYLGKIRAKKADWINSGAYFETAGRNFERSELSIQKKIKEIEKSSFAEERKKMHISQKQNQLKKMQLTKATALYNAAAGFYNGGMKAKALQLAQKAADHPALKDKAEELLKLIKK